MSADLDLDLAAEPDRRQEYARWVAEVFAEHATRAVEAGEPELAVLLVLAAARRRARAGAKPLDSALQRAFERAFADVRLDQVIARHPGRALDAAWSPDGALIASVGAEGEVRVWDAEARSGLLARRAHEGRIVAAAFDPVRPRVLSAGEDGSARLIDLIDAREISVLGGHIGTLLAATFSADGARLVTAADAWSVRLWFAETGASGPELAGHDGLAVYAAAFDPEGARVATGGDDATARIWRVEDGANLKVLAHTGPVRDLAWSADGAQLATASYDGFFRLWRARDGRLERLIASPAARPKFVFADAAGDWRLVSEDGWVRRLPADGRIAADDRASPERAAEGAGAGEADGGADAFQLHPRALMGRPDVRCGATLTHVAAAGVDGWASAWAIPTDPLEPARRLARVKVADAPVHAARLDPAGRRLLTADATGRVATWSLDPAPRSRGRVTLAAAEPWAKRADRAFTTQECARFELDADETRPWLDPIRG